VSGGLPGYVSVREEATIKLSERAGNTPFRMTGNVVIQEGAKLNCVEKYRERLNKVIYC
jgi:hypothetical protein